MIPAVISGWLHADSLNHAVHITASMNQADEWQVTVDQVLQWKDNVLWIDARENQASDQRGVPGALPLNEDDWDQEISEVVDAWRPGSRLVVYCDAGFCNASREVARRLRDEIGLSQVYYLRGGVEALDELRVMKNDPFMKAVK
jgi:rhodanese-related sulfurtransferase